jgi:predicted component of type VI protein secretion system
MPPLGFSPAINLVSGIDAARRFQSGQKILGRDGDQTRPILDGDDERSAQHAVVLRDQNGALVRLQPNPVADRLDGRALAEVTLAVAR